MLTLWEIVRKHFTKKTGDVYQHSIRTTSNSLIIIHVVNK